MLELVPPALMATPLRVNLSEKFSGPSLVKPSALLSSCWSCS